jgi:hypothetical protein
MRCSCSSLSGRGVARSLFGVAVAIVDIPHYSEKMFALVLCITAHAWLREQHV